ncbi:hypothetical protein P4822_14860, partial [Listeria monocytogenes]|nr:hypothetical protein [Listeria monocytogenes]
MDGYKLFRKDRQGRKGGGVALYVREQYDYSELRYETAEKPECLWIKFRSVCNKSDVVVGVCYRPPDRGMRWTRLSSGNSQKPLDRTPWF